VALTRILCARLFGIQPALEVCDPDLGAMLARSDAALIIGDSALSVDSSGLPRVEKIDLGGAWTAMTALPFVYAFWAGRPGALDDSDVRALQAARDAGIQRVDQIARTYYSDAPGMQAIGARYLRDNIRYEFGEDEREGLMLFYRYGAELGVLPAAGELRFY
jgi:chorismate dehydratase